jgi:quercetin dioxygenase-like cupin family protein
MAREDKTGPQLPAAEAVDLAPMVEYATGSIVSRTLAEGQAGTLTLFAFDAGQALSEHTAPFDAFILVLDGRAELTIGGQRVQAGAGQVVLMPAGVPHALRAPQRFKMLLTMFKA